MASPASGTIWPSSVNEPSAKSTLGYVPRRSVYPTIAAIAARVAASTWADPYLVVLAGMSAAGGPLHGGASRAVRTLLAELRSGVPADTAIAERLRQTNLVPGTGHPVYEGPDPRCSALLRSVDRLRPPRDLRAAMAAIVGYTERRGTYPNVDFALGSFTELGEMVPDAGEAIYLVARTVGWIAHALEEYEHRLRFRPRAVYTGPAPVDD